MALVQYDSLFNTESSEVVSGHSSVIGILTPHEESKEKCVDLTRVDPD